MVTYLVEMLLTADAVGSLPSGYGVQFVGYEIPDGTQSTGTFTTEECVNLCDADTTCEVSVKVRVKVKAISRQGRNSITSRSE